MKINLLKYRFRRKTIAEQVRTANKIILIGGMSAFMVLVLAILVPTLYFNFQLSALTTKSIVAESQYASRAADVVRYLKIKTLLAQVDQIIGDRYAFYDLFESIYQTFPPGVTVTSADFSDKTTLRFSGTATSIQTYDSFLKKFKEQSADKNFLYSEVVQDTLSRTADGKYGFNLSLIVKK